MIIEVVASLVGSRGAVDLTSPDYVIMIQIIKVRFSILFYVYCLFYQSKCGVSIIKDYYKFHKLNMQQVIAAASSNSSTANIDK